MNMLLEVVVRIEAVTSLRIEAMKSEKEYDMSQRKAVNIKKFQTAGKEILTKFNLAEQARIIKVENKVTQEREAAREAARKDQEKGRKNREERKAAREAARMDQEEARKNQEEEYERDRRRRKEERKSEMERMQERNLKTEVCQEPGEKAYLVQDLVTFLKVKMMLIIGEKAHLVLVRHS